MGFMVAIDDEKFWCPCDCPIDFGIGECLKELYENMSGAEHKSDSRHEAAEAEEKNQICNMLKESRRDKDEVEKKLNNARIAIKQHVEKQTQLEHETREKINYLLKENLRIKNQLHATLSDTDKAEKKLKHLQVEIQKLEAKQKQLETKNAKKIQRLLIEKQRISNQLESAIRDRDKTEKRCDLEEEADSQQERSEAYNVRFEECFQQILSTKTMPLNVVNMKQTIEERFDINRLFRDMENRKKDFLCGLEVKFSEFGDQEWDEGRPVGALPPSGSWEEF